MAPEAVIEAALLAFGISEAKEVEGGCEDFGGHFGEGADIV